MKSASIQPEQVTDRPGRHVKYSITEVETGKIEPPKLNFYNVDDDEESSHTANHSMQEPADAVTQLETNRLEFPKTKFKCKSEDSSCQSHKSDRSVKHTDSAVTNAALTSMRQHEDWVKKVSSLQREKTQNLRTIVTLTDKPGLIIFPDDKFYQYWSSLVILIMIYTATVVPYKVVFMEKQILGLEVFDIIVDLLFLGDIIVTSFLAYYDEDNEIVTRKRQIFMKYLTSWMLIDIIGILPVQYMIESGKNYNNLLRVSRLPRLFKLIRLTRLNKIKRLNNPFKSHNRKIHVSAEVEGLIWLALAFFVSVHLFACFWGLIGQEGPDPSESWIFIYQYVDESEFQSYLVCVYWALTTLTTVGYGDICPQNYAERIYAWAVMIVGIFIYSYIIGAMSGLVSNINAEKNILNKKYETLNKLVENYQIDPLFYRKIHKALDFVFEQDNKQYDELLDSLPIYMKNQLLSIIYKTQLQDTEFFKGASTAFIGYVTPKLKQYRYEANDFIYKRKSRCYYMYFLIKGSVSLNLQRPTGQQIRYKTISEGQHFGQIDLLMNPKITYTDSARAIDSWEVLAISREELLDVFSEFPDFGDEFYAELEGEKEYVEQEQRRVRMTQFASFERRVWDKKAELQALEDATPIPSRFRNNELLPTSFSRAASNFVPQLSPSNSIIQPPLLYGRSQSTFQPGQNNGYLTPSACSQHSISRHNSVMSLNDEDLGQRMNELKDQINKVSSETNQQIASLRTELLSENRKLKELVVQMCTNVVQQYSTTDSVPMNSPNTDHHRPDTEDHRPDTEDHRLDTTDHLPDTEAHGPNFDDVHSNTEEFSDDEVE